MNVSYTLQSIAFIITYITKRQIHSINIVNLLYEKYNMKNNEDYRNNVKSGEKITRGIHNKIV